MIGSKEAGSGYPGLGLLWYLVSFALEIIISAERDKADHPSNLVFTVRDKTEVAFKALQRRKFVWIYLPK